MKLNPLNWIEYTNGLSAEIMVATGDGGSHLAAYASQSTDAPQSHRWVVELADGSKRRGTARSLTEARKRARDSLRNALKRA